MPRIHATFQSYIHRFRALHADRRGASAVEFAFIMPLMMGMLFGLVEITNGISADRKVTLTARALSDLISQTTNVSDSDLTDTFAASGGVMSPFDATAIKSVVSEVKIDNNGTATVVWSKANANGLPKTSVTLPANLAVPNTYLIWSDVSYVYNPGINWFITSPGITLKEQLFTRPRQSTCVLYKTAICP